MCYLHESEIKVHGNLKSTNCVVTSRWSLQVSDYGLHELREGQQFENEMQRYKGKLARGAWLAGACRVPVSALLWTAPELLMAGAIDRPQRGTQKGDVFSFGVVLHEIFSRMGPYGIEADCNFTPKGMFCKSKVLPSVTALCISRYLHADHQDEAVPPAGQCHTAPR